MWGRGGSCLHNCLASSSLQYPYWKRKTSLKSLFNFGCSSQGLVTVLTGWQEWRALCQAECTCPCGSVAPVPPGWLIPLMVGIMREHGVTQGSVQSQKWLSVLILSLLLMLQGPSFYHRLRSNNMRRKEKDIITKNAWWQQFGHSDFMFPLLIKTFKITI